MDEDNKKAALKAVEALKPLSSTNLWHGLKLGLKVLEEVEHVPQNVQALYVLTDGMCKTVSTRIPHANANKFRHAKSYVSEPGVCA